MLSLFPKSATGKFRVERCPVNEARWFIGQHHSRLPKTQRGPWKYAFAAYSASGDMVASALWHNPSARTLPAHWLELRRLAVGPVAPHCTSSRMIAAMVRDLKKCGHTHFISYQDAAVHTGTIYKASGWRVEYVGKWRDRSRWIGGRKRDYRTSINGAEPDRAPKVRWGLCFGCGAAQCETQQNELLGSQQSAFDGFRFIADSTLPVDADYPTPQHTSARSNAKGRAA